MSNQLSRDLQRTVKKELERLSCPQHGKHPKVEFRGDRASVDCCCESFKKNIEGKLKGTIAKAMEEEIRKALKF